MPTDEGIEVAFVGRSNVGKSSAINAITEIRHLCKTSKTPGRTQLINLFGLDEHRRLVDLPGYGFAQVAIEIKLQWQKTLAAYLEERHCLKGIVLLVDIRHLLKPVDHSMLEWAIAAQLPVHILLTKSDKLSRQKINESIQALKKVLATHFGNEHAISVQAFSIHSKESLHQARAFLDSWYGLG